MGQKAESKRTLGGQLNSKEIKCTSKNGSGQLAQAERMCNGECNARMQAPTRRIRNNAMMPDPSTFLPVFLLPCCF